MNNCAFIELTSSELSSIDGGWSLLNVGAAFGIFDATCGICAAIGGETVLSMGVGALVACGPIGWGILAIGVVGGAAAGYALMY